MQWKLNIMLAAVLTKVKVLYMDTDITLLKNPFPFLNQYQDMDFVAQKSNYICAGFLYFWPTHRTLQLLDTARRIGLATKWDDQLAINYVTNSMKPNISYQYLPTDKFMNGRDFFSRYQYYWEPLGMNE